MPIDLYKNVSKIIVSISQAERSVKRVNIGFIGAGQIGGAMIKGLLAAKTVAPDHLFVKGGSSGTAEDLQKKMKFHLVEDYTRFQECDILFVATGGKVILDVLRELAPNFSKKTILISVASGHTIEEAQEILGKDSLVVHAIPNTPVSVNSGMIGATFSNNLNKKQHQIAYDVLASLGKLEEVPETLLGTFGTVAGCSPAFVDIFIEALSDGAVMQGLSRSLSYEIIPQMLLGSAKLALETKKHPGELKDDVTSPGGSTIKGVAALEKNGFRHAVIDAINQANS